LLWTRPIALQISRLQTTRFQTQSSRDASETTPATSELQNETQPTHQQPP
jgi:hypothetical protein